MSSVIAIRISKELKKELDDFDIDYAQHVRECLENIVKQKLLAKNLAKASDFRKKLEKKVGTLSSSAESIREDRDYGH